MRTNQKLKITAEQAVRFVQAVRLDLNFSIKSGDQRRIRKAHKRLKLAEATSSAAWEALHASR